MVVTCFCHVFFCHVFFLFNPHLGFHVHIILLQLRYGLNQQVSKTYIKVILISSIDKVWRNDIKCSMDSTGRPDSLGTGQSWNRSILRPVLRPVQSWDQLIMRSVLRPVESWGHWYRRRSWDYRYWTVKSWPRFLRVIEYLLKCLNIIHSSVCGILLCQFYYTTINVTPVYAIILFICGAFNIGSWVSKTSIIFYHMSLNLWIIVNFSALSFSLEYSRKIICHRTDLEPEMGQILIDNYDKNKVYTINS